MEGQSDPVYQQRRDAFTFFGKVDRVKKDIYGTVVALMGITRTGKSTCYNLITAPQTMIGRRSAANNFYQLLTDKTNPQIQFADVKPTLQSVTKMPNIAKLKIANTSITLMDFAGFSDKRIPIEILTVNYIQASFLKAIKDIKFVLVFTEKGLIDISDNALKKTLEEFLNIFNFNTMKNEEDRNQLYSSVSFLVTSANNNLDIIIEQLQEIKNKFQELHNSNSKQFKNFQIMIALITNIIKYKRIDVVPISKENIVGKKLTAIQTFWEKKKGWNSFNLQKHGDKIQSAYMEQVQNLKEQQEQNMLRQTIKWRFDLCGRFKSIVCQIIKKIIDNIAIKQYDIQEEIKDLKVNFIDKSFYQNVPSFQYQTSEIVKISLQQRVKLLCKIIDFTYQLKLQSVWRSEQNNNVKSQEGYIKFIQNIFNQELSLLNNLFGTTRELRILFKQIYFMFSNMFTEATNLILLDTQYADKLLIHLCQYSSWGDQLYINAQDLKIKFINALVATYQKKKYIPGYFSQQQIQKLIIYSIEEEPKLKDLSPTIAFTVGYKFNLLKNTNLEITLQSSSIEKYLQNLLRALFYTLKHVACVNKTNKLQTLNKGLEDALLETQKYILSKIIKFLSNDNRNYNIILEICTQLRQYSEKCTYFERIIQSQPTNEKVIHTYAKYCREIGKSQRSKQLFQKLKKIKKVKPQQITYFEHQINQIKQQQIKLNQKYSKLMQQQQQTLFDCVKGMEIINKIRGSIMKISGILKSDFAAINQRYRLKMKSAFAAEEFKLQFPKNPTLSQYIEISHQLIAMTKDKKLTVLISASPNTGQTTLFYEILGKKLYFSNGKYYINQHFGWSRINNSGNNPSIFPNICPLNDKEELLVDFPLLPNSPPQKILIVNGIFEKMLKQCRQFRLVLVIKPEQVFKNEGVSFMGLINYLLTIFDIAQISNNARKGSKDNQIICKSVLFTFTFMTSALNIDIRKKMEEFRSCLKDDLQSIQNESKYKLVKAQQNKCLYIIENVYFKGRCKNMMIPSKEFISQSPTTQTLLSDLMTNQNNENKWLYINGQKVRNMGSTTLYKMMESQRSQVVKYMRIKIEKIKQILNFLLNFTSENYKYFVVSETAKLNISFLNNLKHCIPQSQNNKQVPNEQTFQSAQEVMKGQKGEEMKLVRYYCSLISLKLISFDEVNSPISNFERPSQYFDKLIAIVIELFTNVAHMCPNQTEENIIKKVMMFAKSLLVEIKGYSYIMNSSQKQPFDRLRQRQANSGIAQTMGKVLQIKNLCEAILQRELPQIMGHFLDKFSPKQFENQCSKHPEHTEKSLLDYQFILQKIYSQSQRQQKKFNLPFNFNIIATLKAINEKLIQVYKDWSKQRQLSLAYIKKIFLLYEEEQYKKRYSKRLTSININNFSLNYEIERTLIKITQEICVVNKDLAMQICQELMSFRATKQKIYGLLIQKEDNFNRRIIYMQQLYQFLNKYQMGFNQKQQQIGQRLTKIKVQMRAKNHPQYLALNSWFERIPLLEKRPFVPRSHLNHEQIKKILNQITKIFG